MPPAVGLGRSRYQGEANIKANKSVGCGDIATMRAETEEGLKAQKYRS